MAKSTAPSSPTFRLLTHLTVPPDLTTTIDFDETDVLWSDTPSPSPSNVSTSPPLHRPGLYAALSDDHHPLVRRKPAISPSQSAATAARTIPPVSVRRSSEHYHQSAPVNVPVWPTGGYVGRFDEETDDVAEDIDDGEMIPPHEIVARSYVTFSVFEGAGRTLKGRDLRRVRNAVFQKTGFLD